MACGILPRGNDVPRAARFAISHIANGVARSLLDLRLDPAARRADRRWRQERIDLEPLASGHPITLRFGSWASQGQEALWASPRVLYPRRAGRPNIVLVSLDTLRADHLNCYGYTVRRTSPEIDRIAAEGTRFATTITTAPWTTPSHMSIFTGLYPAFHGVNAPIKGEPQRLPASIPTLAEVLRGEGYATMAVTGAGTVSARFGFARGFDSYRERRPRKGNDVRAGLREVSGWLGRHREEPFFVFFHTFEVHRPWTHDLFPVEGDERTVAAARYDGDVRYTDSMMGRLLARLAELGLRDETILVVLSDHGENLYDRMVDLLPIGHGYHVFDEMIRVPLIFSSPAFVPEARVVHQQVRLIDVMPTLLDLVGAAAPEHVQGVSLRPFLGRDRGAVPRVDTRRAFIEATAFGPPRIAVRTATRKYVFIPSLAPDPARAIGRWKRWDDLPTKTLYDLERDPAETRNVAEERPEETASFHRLVERHVAEASAFVTHHQSARTETNAELQDELRELGYIE